ncbi:MAG TPA: SHOCT domain-containing protein [Actinomycetes bacterium]|nr:SHOCT domain-containing protein [Actinomycetes bacterium]
MDLVESLEHLAALRRDGALTEEEYSTAKSRLLEGGVAGTIAEATPDGDAQAPDAGPPPNSAPSVSEDEFVSKFAALGAESRLEPGLRLLYEQIREGDLDEEDIYVLGPATGRTGVPSSEGLLVMCSGGLLFAVEGAELALTDYSEMAAIRCFALTGRGRPDDPPAVLAFKVESKHFVLGIEPDFVRDAAGCLWDCTEPEQWVAEPTNAALDYTQSEFGFASIAALNPSSGRFSCRHDGQHTDRWACEAVLRTPKTRAAPLPPPVPTPTPTPTLPKPLHVPAPARRGMSTGAVVAIVLAAVVLIPIVLITLLGDNAEDSLARTGEAISGGTTDDPSTSEAIDLLTDELVTSADLPRSDARCVSQVIVGDIGVDGLAEIGLAASGSGDFTDLSTAEQDRLFDLITGAFDACGIAAN